MKIGLWQKLDEFEAYIGKTEPNRTTGIPLSREETLALYGEARAVYERLATQGGQ